MSNLHKNTEKQNGYGLDKESDRLEFYEENESQVNVINSSSTAAHPEAKIDLLSYIPKTPLLTKDFKESKITSFTLQDKTKLLTTKIGNMYKAIQINEDYYHKLFVIDIDTDYHVALDKAKEVDLPPNFIIANKDNHKAHFIYCLEHPVAYRKNPRTRKLLEFIRSVLTYWLGGDTGYVNKNMKNPWNEESFSRLHIHAIPYTLKDMRSHLTDEMIAEMCKNRITYAYKPPASIQVGERNNMLFSSNLIMARKMKESQAYCDKEEFYNIVFQNCIDYNNKIPEPLDLSEVKSVAKSVANTVWEKPIPKTNILRGKMALEKGGDLASKQSLSAYQTHRERTASTIAKLKQLYPHYCDEITSKPSIYSFAKFTETCPKTVKKYWEAIQNPNKQELEHNFFPTMPIKINPANYALPKDKKYKMYFEKYKLYLFNNMGSEGIKTNVTKIASALNISWKTAKKYLPQFLASIKLEAE